MERRLRIGRGAWGSLGLLVLGGLGASVLVGAAWVDFGDPGAALERRVDRAAAEEAQWVARAWERLCVDPALPAEPRGEVVRAPLSAGELRFTNELESDSDANLPGSGSVFSTLFRAGLSRAVAGDREAALERVREALSLHGHQASASERAHARLRELAWAHAEGETGGARAARAILLAEGGGEQRDGVPYALLAALAGPVDGELFMDLSGRLQRGELAFAPQRPRVEFDGGELSVRLGPRDQALLLALTRRAPEEDWERALGLDQARSAALLGVVPLPPELSEERWEFHPWPAATADGAQAPWILAQRVEGDERTVLSVSRADLAAALQSRAASEPEGDRSGDSSALAAGPNDLFQLRVAPEAASLTALDTRILGPNPVPGAGLVFDLLAPDLAREVARERRRLLAVRAGLMALGVLVALAAALSARALARERRLGELRSTFVAGVSHDLRTPLASILLLVENLERGSIATESARGRYHGALRQEAERLLRMVEDLLDASRVERGDGPRIAAAPVAMGPFLDELEQALAERAAQVGADLAFSREAVPKEWVLDAEAVRRAVWNLFENALRHGRAADGSVRVAIEVRADGQDLAVEVRDQGPGIPARHRESVFRPFVRGVDTKRPRSTMDEMGTGLGLAIVRAIARAHGGDANVLPSARGAHLRLLVGHPKLDDGESVA